MNMNLIFKKLNINDKWIVGFIDGEGCFSISFTLRSKMKLGFEIRPSFSVSQKNDREGVNCNLLLNLKEFFNAGTVRFSKSDQTWKYEVRDLKDLAVKIVPFFELNSLETSKCKDFGNFAQVVKLINSSHHLSVQGAIRIIDLSFVMNVAGKRKYTKEFLLKLINKVKV